MVYLVVLLLCTLMIRATRNVREPNLAAFLVACGLATFVALRGAEVGNDFMEYEEWYRIGTNAQGLLERPPLLEALFLAAMTAGNEAGLPFRFFLWAVAVSAITVKVYSIRRIAVSGVALWAGASCYLFSDFLLHEFTQLRAGLAIACFMLSLVLLTKGRVWAYVLVTFLGALIHSAALLGLFALPLSLFRRGRLDILLVSILSAAALTRVGGIFTVERMGDTLSMLDARLALYVQFAVSGASEPVQPFSLRTMLMLVLILTSYVALIRQSAHRHFRTQTESAEVAFLTMLRLIVLGQIALFLFADLKEVAIRVMEFWMACLPLYAVHLAQTRGMKLPSAIIWLWLMATFGNYVFRSPVLVGPYSIGF